MIRKLFLLYCFSVLTFGQAGSIHELINKHQNTSGLNHAQWSLSAKYTDTDEIIIDYNSDQSLAPASGLKLFTTAAALDILGEDFQFSTKFYYDGTILPDGTLDGNIFIVGGGDPTLGSDLVNGSLSLSDLKNKIIFEIKKLGIKAITGSVIADATLYNGMTIPRLWIWEDIGNYYGAQATSLCLNDNLYKLFFQPNKIVGEKAELLRTNPAVPGLKFLNYMSTGAVNSGDNGYVFCAPGQYTAELRGSIPKGYNEFSIKGAIPDPPLFAAQYFSSEFVSAGIEIKREPMKLGRTPDYSQKKLFCEIKSPPLKDIVYYINKKSYNLYAEMLLKAIGYNQYGKGNISSGVKAVKSFVSNMDIDTSGIMLYDGSGLSRSNTVTANAMTDLLKAVKSKIYFVSFYNSLGIAGKKDDLSSFKRFGTGTPIANNARIKSGYVKNVRSHSGFVKDKNGRLIAFSFIANNFNSLNRTIDNIHKQILILLAEIN